MKQIFPKYNMIIDPPREGLFNMEKDVELMKSFSDGDSPIFRLYTWDPWCLSLGYNQNDESILKDKLKADGYDLVRRPTGGRGVFHANELTYSVITQIDANRTKTYIYQEIHTLIAEVLNRMGIKVDFVKTNPDFKNFYKSDERSVSCFASSARYELTFGNKKIVGSAQRVFGNKLLQHGSILLDKGFERIADYITDDMEKAKRLKDFTLNTAIPINDISSEIINTKKLEIAFHETFQALSILA
ncbi:lipoate--protein ligase family protein [bacterium]|nr:MAG: lipoate--protein ligase family protein [bacterium]